MRILMFGWEFPPHNTGGLGTACAGITWGLLTHNLSIAFVLPKCLGQYNHNQNLQIIDAKQFSDSSSFKKLSIKAIDSFLSPYDSQQTYSQRYNQKFTNLFGNQDNNQEIYGKNLMEEVWLYGEKAGKIAQKNKHDIIHAHDWMSFGAGAKAQKVSKKPFIAHVHATEFDRTGGNPNQAIYNLERQGMHQADHIIAVSELTKQKIIENYGIAENKIDVVHNATTLHPRYFKQKPHLNKLDKIVLFLGRLTLQKGPEYFLQAAQKVLTKKKRVKFIMAGNWDMMQKIIHQSIALGISKNILFSGFLRGAEIDRAYQQADLYVMPSVSEPFGITSLEAIQNWTPVLMSKQSGVAEVISNALKVDFWDIDEMANKILAVLELPALHHTLQKSSSREIKKISWEKQAQKIKTIYEKLII